MPGRDTRPLSTDRRAPEAFLAKAGEVEFNGAGKEQNSNMPWRTICVKSIPVYCGG